MQIQMTSHQQQHSRPRKDLSSGLIIVMGATDSKLAFRKGVFRLFEERNIPVDADDYWSLFWTLPESIDDVFSLVGATDIRRAQTTAIENIETLIDKVLEQMESIVHHPNFLFAQNSVLYLLNCCRVLTRIMPFVFESPDGGEWETQYFWTPRSAEGESMEKKRNEEEDIQCDILPPRAHVMMTLTLECLFLAGFSLPPTMATKETCVNYVIWETGVGSSIPIGSYRDNDACRNEVLRLLLVLLSKAMYNSPSHVITKEDMWLHFIVTSTNRKVVLALLCSLLNTACKFNPMGWGVPYNHVMFTDTREQLVSMSLRTLLVITDYCSPKPTYLPCPNEPSTSKKTVETPDLVSMQPENEACMDMSNNIFRYYLSKLHRTQDFQFLIDGIYRILSHPMQTNNSYFPGPTKRIKCHIEMIMLCWKLLETNKRFRTYLMDTERALDLMIVLIYHGMENKLNLAQVGVVRMCAFILQTLSSEPMFGVKLNKPFENHISLPIAIRIPLFRGSYADFLLISIFTMIATSRGHLSTLYPALVLTVTNISAHVTNLSSTSSSKLTALFGSISAPGFIFADETNYRLVEYLLEAFNNIIQSNYKDNLNFIYALIRKHTTFENLKSLTLENGLAEIERLQQAKKDTQDHLITGFPSSSSLSSQRTLGKILSTGGYETGLGEEARENVLLVPSDALSEKSKGKKLESAHEKPTTTSSSHLHQNESISSTVSYSSLIATTKHSFTPSQAWVIPLLDKRLLVLMVCLFFFLSSPSYRVGMMALVFHLCLL
ncbi:high-temperature-induced dauer-formation protein-domain-containing protein [Spinellus fusiger]|nr:high-temperature-induced dauer-formation protein-domain-containing protein [Spinellus fusiger]